ncbi:MAG: Ser-Thr-rich GPI-anchored membrane family protein [Leptospirales bacterium]
MKNKVQLTIIFIFILFGMNCANTPSLDVEFLGDDSSSDGGSSIGIVVDVPDGGESIIPSTLTNITWSQDIDGNVSIDLYKGGVLDSTITANTPNDGLYAWTVPPGLTPGVDYRIKITSIETPSTSDQSNADFTVISNTIVVTVPNGGELYTVGDTIPIAWASDIGGTVKIELLVGGIFDQTISSSTANDNAFNWVIPAGVDTSQSRIKITSIESGAVLDDSDADYSIIESILVTAPDGGEVLGSGGATSVTWTAVAGGNVKIELFKGGVFDSNITTSTANDGSYTWNINPGQAGGQDYTVVITHLSNAAITDNSNANFAIVDSLLVSTPNGSETYGTGENFNITWSATNSGTVQIDLLKNNIFDSAIIASTPNDGSYNWTVPGGKTGLDYTIRLTFIEENSITDDSDANFALVNTLVVTAPNTGLIYETGDSVPITWTSGSGADFSGNVKIELLKSNVFDSTIIASTPNDGTYNWTIPGTQATDITNYKIRITDVFDGAGVDLTDDSDLAFSIGKLNIISPNTAGIKYQVGSSQTITWNYDLGVGANVKIELYKGGVFNSTISATTANDGSFSWPIPGAQAEGTNYKVVITSLGGTAFTTQSANNFTITHWTDLGFLSASITNYPAIVAVDKDNVYCVYNDGGSTLVYVDKYSETGGSWTAVGGNLLGGASGARMSITAKDANTPVVAVGNADDFNRVNILEWNGASWISRGKATTNGTHYYTSIALNPFYSNYPVVAFEFSDDIHLKEWNGASWSNRDSGGTMVGTNFNYPVVAVTTNGNRYISVMHGGTDYKIYRSLAASTTTSLLKTYPDGVNTSWHSMVAVGNTIYFAFAYKNSSSSSSYYVKVYSYDGTTWTLMGYPYGPTTQIYGLDIAVDGANPVVIIDNTNGFSVYRWNSGTSWDYLGNPGNGNLNNAHSLAVDPSGNIYIGFKDTSNRARVYKYIP